METPTSSSAALGASIASISDLLNLPGSGDLLDDADFESTMMMFDHAESALALMPRRHSVEQLDLSLSSLVDFLSHGNTGESDVRDEPHPPPLAPNCLSPDLKLRINGRISFSGQQQQQQQQYGGAGGVMVKQEPGAAPELSPVMDSFLRETWEDIVDGNGSKSARSSWKMAPTPSAMSTPAASASARITPLPHSFVRASTATAGAKSAAATAKAPIAVKKKATATASAAVPASSASVTADPLAPKPSKPSRRAKQCIAEGCERRAQSNNRCKTHGGGARCQMPGCDKSSQGGGLCRAHGGGKKCRVPGCTKGTQRLGLCYLHGGIRRCITEGCKKKDRGNGYCISHGGGRRCEVAGCDRSVRKGNRCQTHQLGGDTSPFQITRGQGLAFP